MALGELKRYEYRGIMLTASQIAIQSQLSLPTVLRRIRAGITGNDLGAPARTVPLPSNSARFNKSDAIPSLLQARQYLRKAQQRFDDSSRALASAIQRREMLRDIEHFRQRNAKAELNVAYWREMIRQAEVRENSASPIDREGRLCPCCGQPLPYPTPNSEAVQRPSNSILEGDQGPSMTDTGGQDRESYSDDQDRESYIFEMGENE